jgi:hypothetical protein
MPCSEGNRRIPEDFNAVRRRWNRAIVGSRTWRTNAEDQGSGRRLPPRWEALHQVAAKLLPI